MNNAMKNRPICKTCFHYLILFSIIVVNRTGIHRTGYHPDFSCGFNLWNLQQQSLVQVPFCNCFIALEFSSLVQ